MPSLTSMPLGSMLGLGLLALSLSLGRPASARELADSYARITSFVPRATSTTFPLPCSTWAPLACPWGQAAYSTYSAGCPVPAGCTPTPTARPCPSTTPPSCATGYGTGYTMSSECRFPICTARPLRIITPCINGHTTVSRTVARCTWQECSTDVPTGQNLYGQCGGSGWLGFKSCAEGTCFCYNDFYCDYGFVVSVRS